MTFVLCPECEDIINDNDVKCPNCDCVIKKTTIKRTVVEEIKLGPSISSEELEKGIKEGRFKEIDGLEDSIIIKESPRAIPDDSIIFQESSRAIPEDSRTFSEDDVILSENSNYGSQEGKPNEKVSYEKLLNDDSFLKILGTIFIKVVIVAAIVIFAGGSIFNHGLLDGLLFLAILYFVVTLLGFVWKRTRNCILAVVFLGVIIFVGIHVEEWIYSIFGSSQLVESIVAAAFVIPPILYDVSRIINAVKAKKS